MTERDWGIQPSCNVPGFPGGADVEAARDEVADSGHGEVSAEQRAAGDSRSGRVADRRSPICIDARTVVRPRDLSGMSDDRWRL